MKWRPHPWHGLNLQDTASDDVFNAFIEMTPADHVKYEVCKITGYLLVDRPQRASNLMPTLYGFVPQTFCGERVRALMAGATSGDGDPLDICVISERPIERSEVLLRARIIGGLPMLDGGEADDKIVAVLDNDEIWQDVHNISELPGTVTERLRHYFSTYKTLPGEEPTVHVGTAYDREHALAVVAAAAADYRELFLED
jgi:inorganic pyrophosphatase